MFVSPMLLNRIDKPFDSLDDITELKLDGIRLIYSNIRETKLYTRHKNDITTRFPEVAMDLPPENTGLVRKNHLYMPNRFQHVLRLRTLHIILNNFQLPVIDIIG